jgi:uncharacterized protein YbjT (DUF2867 family)
MKIVVIGGTGRIGSTLASRLRGQGHDVVAASPGSGVNTVTGEGLAAAVAGADTVVDVSNSRGSDPSAVMDFFVTSTRNLLHAGSAAGVRHHVALSIVGVDRLQEGGYFRAKAAQERLIRAGTIPHTIVRATQFFEFLDGIADGATAGNTVRLAPVLIQPVAANDVASVMARIVTGQPINEEIDVAGPQPFRLDELIRGRLAAQGDPREAISDPEARYFGALLQERTLVPGAGAVLGAIRLVDWCRESVPR